MPFRTPMVGIERPCAGTSSVSREVPEGTEVNRPVPEDTAVDLDRCPKAPKATDQVPEAALPASSAFASSRLHSKTRRSRRSALWALWWKRFYKEVSAPMVHLTELRWLYVAFGWVALLWAWWVPAMGQAQLKPERVEGLAAVIGGYYPGPGVDVVLRSDVELRARLQLAEAGQFGAKPSPAVLRESLRALISEVLIARESERVQVGDLQPEDVEREWRQMADRVGGPGRLSQILAELGAQAVEIEAMAERRALLALFLSANLEGYREVTAAEVDAVLVAEGEEAPRSVPRERRRSVRRELVQAALEQAVARWTRVLEARSIVRVLARYGVEADG